MLIIKIFEAVTPNLFMCDCGVIAVEYVLQCSVFPVSCVEL